MTMNEGAEGETVSPTEMEVLNIDVFVRRRLALTPQEQTFFGRHLFYGDVLNGEPENNRPDHAEGHFHVAVDDLFGADRDEFHALTRDEIEGFVHVGDLVEAHFSSVGLGQRFARDDLEKEHEFEAVSEVLFDVFADDKDHFAEAGPYGIEDRVVDDGFSVGAYAIKLF